MKEAVTGFQLLADDDNHALLIHIVSMVPHVWCAVALDCCIIAALLG